MAVILGNVSMFFIPVMLTIVIGYGIWKRAPVYDYFIAGTKEGLKTAIGITPFIIAIFIGLEALTSSGAMEFLTGLVSPVFSFFGIPEELLSLILLRPVSGSGSLVILERIVETAGADSFAGRTASVMMGSCETVFYVLAIYFGATAVKNIRHTLSVGVIAYVCGIFISVWLCRIM